MLTRETFIGPWAGLPVAWTKHNDVDEETYRADVARCCEAGIPGVYSGGTTGEFYAMEMNEFQTVARATVEECRARSTPAMVGCTATYTLGAARRAAYAAEIGADAIQVALPFWMPVAPASILPFFKEVSAAAPGVPLSVYATTRAKVDLSLDQHRALKDAVPQYLMVKANAGTLGAGPEGCAQLSQFVNVFVSESRWAELGPAGAVGCCSAMVYWNPRLVLGLWQHLRNRDWARLRAEARPFAALHAFLVKRYAPTGFTDTAFDRMGGTAGGFLRTSLANRAPYPSATTTDVEELRAWYRAQFPEMLRQ